jgi:hypothetical protein
MFFSLEPLDFFGGFIIFKEAFYGSNIKFSSPHSRKDKRLSF